MSLVKSLIFKRKAEQAQNSKEAAAAGGGQGAKEKQPASEAKDEEKMDPMQERIKQRMGLLDQFRSNQGGGAGGKKPRGSVDPSMLGAAQKRKGATSDSLGGKDKGGGRFQLRNHSMFPNEKAVRAGLDQRRAATGAKRKEKKRVTYTIKGEKFILYDYYTPSKIIGKGAYACVCEAYNKKTEEKSSCEEK